MTRLSTICAISLLLIAAVRGADAAPNVIGVSPQPQDIDADAISHIVVTFDTALDPSTINGSTFRVFGRWSGPAAGAFVIDSGNTRVRFMPSAPFFHGEWVTVSLSSGVQDALGTPLSTGYSWNFWVRALAGTLDQTEIIRIPIRQPLEGQIQSYGAYAGDLNNDGWSDLTIPNEITVDLRVFLNDGTGMYSGFAIYPLFGGSTPSTNEGADFNSDGEIDIAVGSGSNNQMHVLMGTGSGTFLPAVNYTAGNGVRGLSIVDLDTDGHDDIVTANRFADNLSLFINNGNGTFGPATSMEANGTRETSCAPADANGDGIQDLFVGTFTSQEIILLVGDGLGGLTYSTKVSAGGVPWMLAVGDVSGDGNVDVVAANSFNNNAAVVLGDGQGGLSAATTYPSGTFPLAIDLGDLDGDGDLDLVTSNYSSVDWIVFENTGNGTFVNPRTYAASAAGSCAILHDRDNDGDLDISAIDEVDDLLFIFENDPVASSVDDTPTKGDKKLIRSYPNPFNPVTTISYKLITSARVSLSVYDVRGAMVAVLVASDEKPAGIHVTEWDASNLASGLYFVQLTAGAITERHTLVLLK